jgi:hypothetical protein
MDRVRQLDMTALIWQPLLTEADSADGWAQATQSLPAAEREKRFGQLVETLTTKDYRELCRTRERILASGPACLDLLMEAFPPATVIEEDRLNVLLQRLNADESEERNRAQTTLIGFGLRILGWVEKQQSNQDLLSETRDRLRAVAQALRTNGFAAPEVGRIRAVGILIEAQDFQRLQAYAKGDPNSHASRMARLVQGP